MKGKAKEAVIVTSKDNRQVSVMDVVVDIGNSLMKVMKHGLPSTVIVIPHALKKTDRAGFEGIVKRHTKGFNRGGASVDVSTFEYNGAYYTVGENAEALGADTRRSGGPKYQPDYYAPLFMALLLRLLPDGHENLRIMAAFPPGDIRHIDTMMASLGGKHVVRRVDGSTVTYKVRQVLTYDEPVGGLRNWLLHRNGVNYRTHQVPTGLGLCIDIGGKISSFVPFRADGWVDYNNAQSVDLGILDVMSTVSDILLSTPEYSKYLEDVRGSLPPDDDMRYALVSGIYNAGGYELPVLDAVSDATQAIRTRLGEVYRQDMGGPRPYKFMIITGGGGGLLYRQLIDHVLNFNQDRIYMAHDEPDEMHLANLFGGDKVLAGMLANKVL